MKVATTICLHVGKSMGTVYEDPISHEQISRFNSGMKAVDQLVEHLAMFGKSDEMGILLYGTEGTEHDSDEERHSHITTFNQVEKGSLAMVNKLAAIATHANAKGDAISAMVVGLDMLKKRTKNKKYSRQIILITDCGGADTDLDEDEIARFVGEANDLGCTLKIIGIDLFVKPDFLSLSSSSSSSSSSSFSSSIADTDKPRWSRATQLFDMVSTKFTKHEIQKPGSIQELLGYVPRRALCKTKTYSKQLSLTSLLGMDVHVFKLTAESKFPSARKMSTLAPEVGQDKVVRHTVHKSKANDVDEEISPDDLVKAYPYGKELVPFTEADVVSMAYKSNQGLSVIGFAAQKDINRAQFLSAADIVLPASGNNHSATAMSALVRAMKDQHVYAIARYVVKAGKGPLVVCLSPHVETDAGGRLLEGLVLNTLPFAEDLRPFRFKSFKQVQVTTEQASAADALIESMDLSTAATDGTEALAPQYTYNPTLQYFYKSLSTRARDPKSTIVPEENLTFSSSSSSPSSSSLVAHGLPLPSLNAPVGCFQNMAALNAFKQSFPTVLRDSNNSKKRKHWGVNKSKEEKELESKGDGSENGSKRGRVGQHITSRSTAVNEFTAVMKDVVSDGDMDKIAVLFSEMKAMINGVAFDVGKEEDEQQRHPLLMALFTAFRKGCIEAFETQEYNQFARVFRTRCIKDNVTHAWSPFVESNSGLILSEESSNGDGVSAEEATGFLQVLLGGGSNATVVTETTASSINLNVVDDEDDMDDELD